MEHNKNLSSIVGTIQDEGPPASASNDVAGPRITDCTHGAVEAEECKSISAARCKPSWLSYNYLLFYALAIAATIIFFAGGSDEQQVDISSGPVWLNQAPYIPALNGTPQPARVANPGDASEKVTVPSEATELPAPVDSIRQGNQLRNSEILERQSLIMMRLDKLSVAIADIRAVSDRRLADNQLEQGRMQAAFQSEIDKVSTAVAALQNASADREEQRLEAGNASHVVEVSELAPEELTDTGGWVVNVVSSGYVEPVNRLMSKLHKHDIPAEKQEVVIDGKVRYRLRVTGFSTSDEARAYAQNLDRGLGLKDPWVSRR